MAKKSSKGKVKFAIDNDNISNSLQEIIGKLEEKYRDSDDFLDIISWNLRWFNDKESERVSNIVEILTHFNSDIFVFEEIKSGSLDVVAKALSENGSGAYEVIYGDTGGDQRVAIMYDTSWVRAKDDILELFGKGQVKTGDNKDAFPRLPLCGYFQVKSPDPSKSGFSFQLVGVHLKSQMNDGSSQRRTAAEKLCWWLEHEASDVDSDTIIIGDWNKGPEDKDWSPVHKLEKEEKVRFKSINDSTDFSHLYYKNKNHLGSRLDVVLVTSDASENLKNKKTDVIRWTTIDELLAGADENTATNIRSILNNIKQKVSDHMPLFSRYYMVDDNE